MTSRAIDFRLDWPKRSQDYIFGGNRNIADDGEAEEDVINYDPHGNNKKTFLAQSFHGGRKHLQSLAHIGLVIVSELGRPSVFITLTCNPYWPDIVEALLPGQTAFDRPDVDTRVLKRRLDQYLKHLRSGKYFLEKIH